MLIPFSFQGKILKSCAAWACVLVLSGSFPLVTFGQETHLAAPNSREKHPTRLFKESNNQSVAYFYEVGRKFFEKHKHLIHTIIQHHAHHWSKRIQNLTKMEIYHRTHDAAILKGVVEHVLAHDTKLPRFDTERLVMILEEDEEVNDYALALARWIIWVGLFEAIQRESERDESFIPHAAKNELESWFTMAQNRYQLNLKGLKHALEDYDRHHGNAKKALATPPVGRSSEE